MLLNAGIALYVSEKAATIQEGVHKAKMLIKMEMRLNNTTKWEAKRMTILDEIVAYKKELLQSGYYTKII